MARKRRPVSFFLWLTFIFAALALQWWIESQDDPHPESSSVSAQAPESRPAKAASTRLRNGFERLEGAVLVDDRNNDGDSFKLQHGNEVIEFRLYFVDAPEKRLHQYNGKRIEEQAAYFDGLSQEQILEIGLKAKRFAEEWLGAGEFTVFTQNEAVYDSERQYAMVRFESDGEWLSEKLVREGLARIHTKGTDLPDGQTRSAFTNHLRNLETEAKRAERGGWQR